MRTTGRLDEHLLAEAKKAAASSGRTLTAVIEDALRESLSRRGVQPARGKRQIPTFGGKGLRPGVDIDDSRGLLELMEDDRDPRRRERSHLRASRRRP